MTPLVSRAAWGARPARSTPARIDNEGMTLHYGGDSPWGRADRSTPGRFAATTDHARCPTILRAWQAFHMSPGWAGTKNGATDIAYSSATCPHGVRYDLRGPNRRTAANGTNAGNSRSCAIVYIAGGSDPVTDGAKRAMLDEADRFGSALRWNHSDWKNTACAGDPIRAWQAAGFPRPTEEDDMTPAERQMLTEIHRAVTAQGDKGGMLVPTWQRVAALLAESRADRGRKVNVDVDVAELADLLRDGLGDEIAGRVADELGKRLGR